MVTPEQTYPRLMSQICRTARARLSRERAWGKAAKPSRASPRVTDGGGEGEMASATTKAPHAPLGYARGIGSPALGFLELHPEPGAGIGDPGITLGQISVGDVVENRRDAELRRHLVAEFGALAEQDARAEEFPAGRLDSAGQRGGIVNRAAEAAIREDSVAGAEQGLDQHDPPGQPEIAVAGPAGGIDVGADMRPRRADETEDVGGGDPHL